MKKLLLVANVAKEHILKFHQPTIRELKNRGWTVDVACAGDEDVPHCDRQFRMKWKRSPISRVTIGEILKLHRIIATGDYDIVYCHTPMGGLASRLASVSARRRGTKVIYCVHGFHFFDGASAFNWMTYYPAERFLAHMTDMIITVNHEDYHRASRRMRKGLKLRLIPGMGADFRRIEIENKGDARKKYRRELGVSEDAIVILYISELTKNKNQTMLIDALKELRDKGKNIFLVLAGPDHEDAYHESYAKRMGVSEYCRFLGWRDDIGELMAMADVYAASSIREGMTVNLIEAMYAELPIVATDNRGHRMALEDCTADCMVKIGDYRDMADRISEAADGNASEKLMLAKSHIAEKYSADRIAGVIADIIESEVS